MIVYEACTVGLLSMLKIDSVLRMLVRRPSQHHAQIVVGNTFTWTEVVQWYANTYRGVHADNTFSECNVRFCLYFRVRARISVEPSLCFSPHVACAAR